MKKLLRRILSTLTLIPIFCLLISNGFCTTIDEIINSSVSSTEQSETEFTTVADNSTDIAVRSNNPQKSYFALQIGVFSDQKDADSLVMDLKQAGYNPYIFQSINSKGQTVFSTRIGKFDSYQKAADKLANLKKNLTSLALITYYNSLEPVNSPYPTGNNSSDKTEPLKPSPSSEKRSSVFNDELTMPRKNVFKEELTVPEKNEIYFESASLQELYDKISTLESEVSRLREESEVRRQLSITEDEAEAEEKDILEAAGREYTLTSEGNIQFSLGVNYAYSEYDAIKASARVEDVADHTISTRFGLSYGLKDNISMGVGIPFVYKYHKIGTVDSLETNDLGNLGLSWQLQPVKSSSDLPTIIINGSFSIPVGRSPYEIAPGEELSTSSGLYSTNLGASISQVSDPVIVFASCNLSYSLPLTDINQKRDEGVLDEVDPGLGLGVSAGMGYALSYKLNLNLSFSYSYSFETKYKYLNAPNATSGVGVSSSLGLGVGYKLSQTQNLNFNIGIPLTSSRSFSFGFSTPIEFEI